jgi:hypothetical protein
MSAVTFRPTSDCSSRRGDVSPSPIPRGDLLSTTHDLTVESLLAEPALVKTHQVRLVAPALVLVLEREAPPRFELAGVETRGDAIALQEFLDSDELALDVRNAFYAYSEDNPFVHERRAEYSERLAKATITS